jgi:ABC-type phosphate/phosphonate transport system substrate-binding protein
MKEGSWKDPDETPGAAGRRVLKKNVPGSVHTYVLGEKRKSPLPKWGLTSCLVVLVLTSQLSLAFSPPSGKPIVQTVRFGVAEALVEEVSPSDAIAATRIWAEKIGGGRNLWKTADVEITSDVNRMIRALDKDELDVACVPTVDYLRLEEEINAVPCITYEQAGQLEVQYLLVARRATDTPRLTDLRDQILAVAVKGTRHSHSELWLSVLLAEAGDKQPEDYFSQVKRVRKPTQAILPVFFGQAAAAVVARSAYETAVELNPQIGQSLVIVAESPEIVPIVVLMRKTMWDQVWDDYILHMDSLSNDPKSLQTFTMYRISQLVEWKPEFANGSRELLRQHRELSSDRQGRILARGSK